MLIPPEEAEQEIICEGIRRILYQYRGQIDDKNMDTVLELVDTQATEILSLKKELKFLKDLDDMQRKRELAEHNDPNAPIRRA